MSLKKKALSGIFWVVIERFGQQLLQVLIFIILARLIEPEEFGLSAMLMIFFAVGQSMVDSGMGQALIREKEITIKDRSTVFWFNLGISLFVYLLIYLGSESIAQFYNKQILDQLSKIMGLSVIFFATAIIQRAELTQKLEFKKQAKAQVPATIIAGFCSIYLGYEGYGVWALAAMYVILPLVSSIILWIISPVEIKFVFSKSSFDRLFGFGYKLFLSGLIDTINQNIYKLVIGKFYNATILGYYSQSKRLQQLASLDLVRILQKVTYPILAKTNNSQKRLKEGYRKIILLSSIVITPITLLIIVFSDPIILTFLGSNWGPAALYLQILCVSGMIYHLHSINLNILKVLGRSDLFLRLELMKKAIITVAILIGINFNIHGLLIAQVISSYLNLLINAYYTSTLLNYSIVEQLRDYLGVLVLSIPMMSIAIFMSFIGSSDSILVLLVYLIIAGLVYFLTLVLVKNESTATIFDLFSDYMPSNFKRFLRI